MTGGWRSDFGNIGSAFSWDGSSLSLTFDRLGGDYIQNIDDLNYFSQLVTGQTIHIFSNHSNGSTTAFLASNTTLTLASIAVPEPSTIAILAIGLIGLGARRFKK